MNLLDHALGSGRSDARRAGSMPPTVIVVGGGGALGSAVLELLLANRRFGHVKVLANRRFQVSMPGLEAVIVDSADALASGAANAPVDASAGTSTKGGSGADAPRTLADCALIVFDRERHANGRELAFVRPLPEQLPAIAGGLRARGVRHLVVVSPHTASTLPEALKRGLANIDEQAVAALGFDHLVFVRSAQAPDRTRSVSLLQRLADGVLAQMQLMVAPTSQPVRSTKVARFVIELLLQLPDADAGTRVVPPELVWQAAQAVSPSAVAALIDAWLGGRELPPLQAPRRRM